MTSASLLASWHYQHGDDELDTLRYLWLRYPNFTSKEIARANQLGKDIVAAGLDFKSSSDEPDSNPNEWNEPPERDASIETIERPKPE